MSTAAPAPGGSPLPAPAGGTVWLAAAGLALFVHLGLLALSWDLPLLTAPAGGPEELRISMAPLGRGSPVSLAPPASLRSNDRANQAAGAPPDPTPEGLSARLPAAPGTASPGNASPGNASPGDTSPRNASSGDTVPGAGLPLAPDPPAPEPVPGAPDMAAAAGPAGEPAPRPRARPSHLERADPPPRPEPPRPEPSRPAPSAPAMPSTGEGGSISGLAPAPGVPARERLSPPVPAAAGSGEGQALLDGYLSRLQGIMQRNRRYPEAALAERRQGVVVLGFSLHRSGRVLGGRVIRSSGHALLDREALDLLYRVAPLPPFPPGIAAERLDLEVPIRFDR